MVLNSSAGILRSIISVFSPELLDLFEILSEPELIIIHIIAIESFTDRPSDRPFTHT